MTSSERSATDRLEELRAKVKSERERVQALEVEQRRARRRVQSALAPLDAYYEQLGALEVEPDEDLERELRAKVREAEGSVAMRQHTRADGRVDEVEFYSPEVEGKLRGARRALEDAERVVEAFLSEHRTELVAALLPAAQAAGERLLIVANALGAARRQWNSAADAFVRIGVPGDEIPDDVFEGRAPGLNQALADIHRLSREQPERLIPAPTWATRGRE